MTMIPSFRPLVVAAAALLLSVYPTLLEAQGQVHPSFPPGFTIGPFHRAHPSTARTSSPWVGKTTRG